MKTVRGWMWIATWLATVSGATGLMAQDVLEPATMPAAAQDEKSAPPAGYQFTVERMLGATPVKNQGRTGTCWSFATASFIESEVVRMGGPALDLSEMFIVRNLYETKARTFLLKQGKTNFSQGALAHDYVDNIALHGLVPDEVFPGARDEGAGGLNHDELETALGGMLKAMSEKGGPGPKWSEAVSAVLDVYIGKEVSSFEWQGRSWTPQEFRDHLGVRAEDYVHLTSFSHHPFGTSFALEIPDNVTSGMYRNVPLDDLMQVIDRALDAGYSIAWDGDVSENGFLPGEGIAVLPAADGNRNWRNEPAAEPVVDQAIRQAAFESLQTTDDHLMHLVGRARDQNGRAYYIVKNSWGVQGKHEGHVYLSEGYVRMKTVAISVHKDMAAGLLGETAGGAAGSGAGAGSSVTPAGPGAGPGGSGSGR